MNSLNSVLLEGTLLNKPVEKTTDSNCIKCTFTVVSQRTYKADEERITELSKIMVQANSTLATSCLKHLEKDRGVRVVGRLKEQPCSDDVEKTEIIIIAEHVEFKPVSSSVKVN